MIVDNFRRYEGLKQGESCLESSKNESKDQNETSKLGREGGYEMDGLRTDTLQLAKLGSARTRAQDNWHA